MNVRLLGARTSGYFCRLGPALVVALLLGAAAPASAQSGGTSSGDWTYELTPYLWASAMKGDV
ncbi:MAG TPA: hypothetical protein VLN59_16610, partial [Burkholderiales bacterium]|nr:hypothetical protein [Burkholderiales bacterium]